MTFLLLLILVAFMLMRNGGVGFVVLAFVWLAACIFNPNVDSGVIWTLGLGLGYLMDNE